MTILTGQILAVLMIGSTHYVDVGKASDAVIYYPSETEAHMRVPDGPSWTGALEMRQDGYFVNWQDGPEGGWQISYEPGVITYIGPDGKPAGTISKIVPGNPENF